MNVLRCVGACKMLARLLFCPKSTALEFWMFWQLRIAFDGSVYLSLHLPSFEVGLSCLFVCCDVAVLNNKYPEVCSMLFPAPP